MFLVREALNSADLKFDLFVEEDGQSAFTYFDQIEAGLKPCPDVILLDLNLPRHSGHSLLARVRRSTRMATTPVVIVSSSDATSDREAVANLGANAYFRKSILYDDFMRLGPLIDEIVKKQ